MDINIEWEYGLDYNSVYSFDIGIDAHGFFIFEDMIASWKLFSDKLTWYNSDLLEIRQWVLKEKIISACSYRNNNICILTNTHVLGYDRNEKIAFEIELPLTLNEKFLYICSFGEEDIFVASSNNLFHIKMTENGKRIREIDLPLKGISGIACDENGQFISISNAADNMVFVYRLSDLGLVSLLGGGFESNSTTLTLHAPRGCFFIRNTILLVADSNNNRVVEFIYIEGGFQFNRILQKDGLLWRPISVASLNDDIIILDSKNRRLVMLDSHGNEKKSTGRPYLKHRFLNLPRALVSISQDSFLVCDSHNNRILKLEIRKDNPTSIIVTEFATNIKWPRHLAKIDNVWVAVSALEKNFLEIHENSGLLCESHDFLDGSLNGGLCDPHQIVRGENGIIIVDSGNGRIISIKSGQLFFINEANGISLQDPHSADFSYSGGVIITDTGNDRLLIFNSDMTFQKEIHELNFNGRKIKLKQPRFVSQEREGKYLVIDTGSRCIFIIDEFGCVYYEIGYARQLSSLSQKKYYCWDSKLFHDPRWVISPNKGNLIVSDTGNSRVVSLTYSCE